MRKKRLFITGALLICGISIGCFSVYRYLHQYDHVVYTQNSAYSNYMKWWYGTQDQTARETAYEKTRSNAARVSLTSLYSGHTIYYTNDNRPFIISGTDAVYLTQGDSGLVLPDTDKGNLRTEYDGRRILIGSQQEVDSINKKFEDARNRMNNKNTKTALIVNSQLVKGQINTRQDDRGNLFVSAADVLGSIGVTYQKSGKKLVCSLADYAGNRHSYSIDVAIVKRQPWTDKTTGNVYPAVISPDFISASILQQCFGFEVKYDAGNRYVEITTDVADVVKPVVLANTAIDSKTVIAVDTAKQLGLLDAKGLLKDDAAKIYQESLQKAAASQQTKTDAKDNSSKNRPAKTPAANNPPAVQQAGFHGSSFNGSSQVITVTGGMSSRNATLSVYESTGSAWVKAVSGVSALIGQNGMAYDGKRVQNTNTTPAGIYNIQYAFGWAENPGTRLEYRVSDDNSYWDENSGSPTYNRWVEGCPGGEFEQLKTEPLYKYALVLDFNWGQTPGKGAGIFIHMKPNYYTGGCVGIDEGALVDLLKRVDPGKNPKVLICPQSDFQKYYY